LSREPLLRPNIDSVVAVGQVVVSSVAVRHLQNVQQEDVHGKLGHNRHQREREVVPQIALPDLVGLRDFGLICKLDNQEEQPRNRKNSLRLASVLHY